MNKYLVEVVSLCILFSFVVSVKSSQFNGRIINGNIANEEYDFAVRILSALSANSPSGYLSTGFAVTSNHVVTVGQAIYGFGIWYIGHGSIHVVDQYESISTDATPHPEYDGSYLHNNIGVIRVQDHISTTLQIRTPTGGASHVFGYGVINNVNQRLAGTLKQTTVYSVSDVSYCTSLFNDVIVRSDNVCSVVIGSYVSNGDQGGPITTGDISGVYAIVSFWNHNGGLQVMVNLNAHTEFISAQLSSNV